MSSIPNTGDRLVEKLWSRVTKTPTCWLWTGATKYYGYGVIRSSGKSLRTHRLSYELAYGAIPAGLFVLHKCDTPRCIRPDHLMLGTIKDNTHDMIAKGRSPRTKLNWDQVKEIRHKYKIGTSNSYQLAREFGVSRRSISMIITHKRWPSVHCSYTVPMLPKKLWDTWD